MPYPRNGTPPRKRLWGAAPFGTSYGSGIFPYGWVPGETPPSLGAYGSEYLEATWEEGWDPGDARYITGNGFAPSVQENLSGFWDVVGDVFQKGAEIVPQVIRPEQTVTGAIQYKPSWEAAKEIALREAAERIAATEAGRAELERQARQQVVAKAQPFIIPVALGIGALLFFAMQRR